MVDIMADIEGSNPVDAALRAEVRAWLKTNWTGDLPPEQDKWDLSAVTRAWTAKVFEAGWAVPTWPREWFGRGLTQEQGDIVDHEFARLGAPGARQDRSNLAANTMLAFGEEALKHQMIPGLLKREIVQCLLYSEPAAGSDLAGVRTRAERDGDDYMINGQKVWTSGAHYSDFGLLLVRTDPDAPKHKGMTMFWLDMKSPGIDIRPIHQMSGASNFNEVYFNDVRVKDSQRVGALNDGWRVSLVTLMNERLAVGGLGGPNWRAVMRLAQDVATLAGPAAKDAGLREKIADWYVQAEGLKYTRYRTQTALSRGQTPGPESSIGKVVSASLMQDMANTALELEDQYGIISDPKDAPLAGVFQSALMSAPGMRIAGGTDEIMRNIIAERVLGLPQDVRLDKDVPFKDVPTGR
jgi:alkylation response protein AidB-like acyl-CoA dehydrogenase